MYSREQQACKELRQLEDDLKLWEVRLGRWSIWQILKAPAANVLMALPLNNPKSRHRHKRNAARVLRMLWGVPGLLHGRRGNVLAKLCTSDFSEPWEGETFQNVWLDEALSERKDLLRMVSRSSYAVKSPKQRFPVDLVDEAVWSMWPFVRGRESQMDQARASSDMSGRLRKHPKLNYITEDYIFALLRRFSFRKAAYERILRKRKVRVAVHAGAEYAFKAACTEARVPDIELQHGIFHEEHPEFLTRKELPYKHNLIQSTKTLVFGQYWQQILQGGGFYGDDVVVSGRYLIDQARRKMESTQKAPSERCQLLFTSQGLDNQKVAHFFLQFLKRCEEQKFDVALTLKLHPIYDAGDESYAQLAREFPGRATIEDGGGAKTFDLMARSDYHLSISSNCHYDALAVGLPTVVLPFAEHESMNRLLEKGHALYVDSPEALVRLIQSKPPERLPADVQNYYCKPGALEVIRNTVEQFL